MNVLVSGVLVGLMAIFLMEYGAAEEGLECPQLCAHALSFQHTDACDGWVADLTWDVGAQSGSCECDGSECRPRSSPQCKAIGVLVVSSSNGKTIWQRVQCNPGQTPVKYAWYCQKVARPNDEFAVNLACYGCGCHSSKVEYMGYAQACGAVNSLSECESPPSGPPTGGTGCHFTAEVLCLDCRAGDELCN